MGRYLRVLLFKVAVMLISMCETNSLCKYPREFSMNCLPTCVTKVQKDMTITERQEETEVRRDRKKSICLRVHLIHV